MICLRQTGLPRNTETQKRARMTLCSCSNLRPGKADIIHAVSGGSVSKKCLRLSSKNKLYEKDLNCCCVITQPV